MNALALEQTSVALTLCVTTQKDRMTVVVLVVIRVMEETAQVNLFPKHLCFYCAIVLSYSVKSWKHRFLTAQAYNVTNEW